MHDEIAQVRHRADVADRRALRRRARLHHVEHFEQRLQHFIGDVLAQAAADDFVGRHVEQVGDVGRGVAHRPVRQRAADQIAVRLDRAAEVDRFARAIGVGARGARRDGVHRIQRPAVKGLVRELRAMELVLGAGEGARRGFEHRAFAAGVEIGAFQVGDEGAPTLARTETAMAAQERRAGARPVAERLRIAEQLRGAERGAFDHIEQAGGVGIAVDRHARAFGQRGDADGGEIFVEPGRARRIAPCLPCRAAGWPARARVRHWRRTPACPARKCGTAPACEAPARSARRAAHARCRWHPAGDRDIHCRRQRSCERRYNIASTPTSPTKTGPEGPVFTRRKARRCRDVAVRYFGSFTSYASGCSAPSRCSTK